MNEPLQQKTMLEVLAYPVGIAVSGVINKVIDYKYTQPQAHRSRRDELYAQHQFRLEELKQQHEQSVIKAYRDSEIKINEQQVIEHIRSSYAVSTNKALYHLYHFETRPNLQQFQLENEQELEILSLQVSGLYDFLAQKNPSKVTYYELEKSVLFLERELDEIKEKKEVTQDCNSEFNFEETEIRSWFAERLNKMAETMIEFDQQEELNIVAYSNELKEASKKLLDSQSRFLIFGDFNRGRTTTILKVLLKILKNEEFSTIEVGLDDTENNLIRTLERLKQSDAIIFVLAADQLFTIQEQNYLKRLLNFNNFLPMIYLINKWEHIEEAELSTYQSSSSGDTSISTAKAGAMGKMVWGATGGTVGTVALGIGGATLANLAGANIVLGTVGAGLALTPVGWALLGASALVGTGVAWWQRRGEVEKFQKEMRENAKRAFENFLKPDEVAKMKEQVEHKFDLFEDLAKQLGEDIISLEQSLNNLLESKRTTEVDCELEAERLQNLRGNMTRQLQIIEAKYQEIETLAKSQAS